MATIEEMVTAVSREVVPDRPLARRRSTADLRALARYGSDKPDVRFGMELVDIGEALAGTDLHIFTDALAAGGAVRALVAAGCAGYSRSRPMSSPSSRCAMAPAGWSTSPSRPTARFAGRWPATCRHPGAGRETCRGGTRRPHPGRGRHRCPPRGGGPRSRRLELGTQLELRTPDVLSYVWVHRFPMFKWDARATAGTRPTTRSAPRCGRWPTTSNAIRLDPRPAVRPGAERVGAGRRIDPDPSPRPAGAGVRPDGPHRRGHARPVRRPARRPRVAPRHTAGSRSASTAGRRCSPTRTTSARSWPSEDPVRSDLMLGAPSPIAPEQLEELGLRLADPDPQSSGGS